MHSQCFPSTIFPINLGLSRKLDILGLLLLLRSYICYIVSACWLSIRILS